MGSSFNYFNISPAVSENLSSYNDEDSHPINVTSHRVRVGKNSDSVKANWDNKTTEVFIRLCVQETTAGNRPGSHFNKIGWDNLVKKFSSATNRNYTRIQLKNKWDIMKKEWGQWKAILHGESGLGWNQIKGTVDATPEWWHKKIQANPLAAKFRERGPLCLYEQEMLFSDVIATGTSSWTPSSGILPPHMQEEREQESQGEAFEDLESGYPQSEPPIYTPTPTDETTEISTEVPREAPPTSSMRKNTEFLNRIRKKKTKKVSNADKISKCLERMVDAMEYDSSRLNGDTRRQYSIQECLEILENMPGIDEGGPLWMYATRIFLKPAIRELFFTIKKNEIRLKWLEEQMERDIRRRTTSTTLVHGSHENDHALSG
ncbi:PREDICTED: uncharacterized protein LOC105953711 [Erythranthe guttata]|uniref:uncharacterized protein LOC105953711 n=1 Tax=Erythranthe guttata TaxID=4155 RepID=UPI00064D8D0D|nr:PREDICTED: uncharacterized protein LOC105953711 [Erythranthe guttata]|eukprot:XP_012832853.1 PREDICTED: uncharacterized protein LOC105953711 [Erythranthe guttata]